jgi:predicted RNA-binding protein with PUA domain
MDHIIVQIIHDLQEKKWPHLLKMEGVRKDVEHYFEVFQRHIIIIYNRNRNGTCPKSRTFL